MGVADMLMRVTVDGPAHRAYGGGRESDWSVPIIHYRPKRQISREQLAFLSSGE